MTNFKQQFKQLGSIAEELSNRVTRLERGSNGETVIKPGDFTAAMYDALENGQRGTIKLEPGGEYHVDETTPIPPKSILEAQGARIIAEADTALLRPWPTARVRDVMLDWHDSDTFDSEGILFLHDDALYDSSIPKPWDRRTPGPVRSWAHARAGSVYHELKGISVDGNRQGKAISVQCEGSANGGIHFVNGTDIQVERADTAIHLFREEGAFQVNSQMFDVHAEDCRIGVHHEHDPANDDMSHMNGNKYYLSWQPDGSQDFSESLWINEEGKNNWMIEEPFFWDLGSRHGDVDHFRFESPFPDKPDYQRSCRNLVAGRHDRSHLFNDQVRNLNNEGHGDDEDYRNKSVGLDDLATAAN